ncbi:DMT family transporter [Haloactinomyces albus]|uniref:Drug/metabolite transporter (DMT)-like permease n=1 Tax=Haloactinomyces albus TaxID=1352928 RepID=A0AAE3Z7X0_9ACTN|nr:DMT family transporter [Haloactinomyces albus]MDR7299987.1 drug/metabolite transporter (DMT)-like permease [Haloactinomyces albus]
MSQALQLVFSGLAALAAGGCLAVTGLLQQRAASSRPKNEQLSLKLLIALVQNKMWLAGIGVAFLSYAFQAVALSLGPLALVQPLLVAELIFAVPISVRWRGARIGRREWAAVILVVAGLVIGIISAYPRGGDPLQPITLWAYALGGIFVIAGMSLVIGRMVSGPPRASLFALSGAAVLGLQSALFAATIALLRQDIGHTFTTWQPYTLIVASLAGMFLVENAYHAGPLAASMPVMDATLPLVSISIGVALFGEQIRTGTLALTGTAVGLALLIGGIIMLDTSSVIRRQQQIEHQDKAETAENEQGTPE